MKFKYLFQIVALLAILVSALGTGQSAQASPQQAVQIVMREPNLLECCLPRLCRRFSLRKMAFEIWLSLIISL